MVERRITDGRRIAQLLASEIDGREDGEFSRLAVVDADRDVEPAPGGARAYDVTRADGSAREDERASSADGASADERFARVFVHEDRAHVELEAGREAAVEAADDAGLRVRPKASRPPKTLVFVESGAAVKRATDVLEAASRAAGASSSGGEAGS